MSTPHKGGNTIELPPWKKGWHRLGQCSLLQALLACREEGAAPARGPGICAALEYAVPLPPKPGILSEVI